MRAARKGGEEQDAFSRYWRQRIHWKRGQLKKAKRRFNKRLRHEGRIDARDQHD